MGFRSDLGISAVFPRAQEAVGYLSALIFISSQRGLAMQSLQATQVAQG